MRNIKFSAWLFSLCCILAGVTRLSAAEGPGISGALNLSDTATSCDGVSVNLERTVGFDSQKTSTDWFCNFRFSDVDPGLYYLHVALPGYIEVHEPVRVDQTLKSSVTLSLKRAIDRATEPLPSGNSVVDASEILSLYPKDSVRFYREAIESRKRGKTEDATRQLERATRIAPDFYAARNDLGLVYESLGRFGDAEDQLWKAHALNSGSATPLINLSALYLATGDLEAAETVSNMAVETDSHSSVAFFNLGMALYRRSEFEPAENAFLKTLSLSPSMLVTRLALVNVYMKVGRLGNASRQLDLYLDNAPDGPQRTQAQQLREQILEIIRDGAN